MALIFQAFEERMKVLDLFWSGGPTDQDVIHVDSYPLEVASQLVHNFWELNWYQKVVCLQ